MVKRRDTNELAHSLVSAFGGLASVLNADIADLMQVKGVTYTIAYFLHAMPYVYRNYKASLLKPKPTINCVMDIINSLGDCVYHLPEEEFYVMCLDGSNRLINYKAVANGGNSQVAIHTRDIVRYAVKHNAKKVVFLHNHPTASPEPSEDDIETTKVLFMAFHVEGIEVFDHVIVSSDESFYSFSQNNLIKGYQEDCISIFKTITIWT